MYQEYEDTDFSTDVHDKCWFERDGLFLLRAYHNRERKREGGQILVYRCSCISSGQWCPSNSAIFNDLSMPDQHDLIDAQPWPPIYSLGNSNRMLLYGFGSDLNFMPTGFARPLPGLIKRMMRLPFQNWKYKKKCIAQSCRQTDPIRTHNRQTSAIRGHVYNC